MFVIFMRSEHFNWMATGSTKAQAEEALRRKWNAFQVRVMYADPTFKPTFYHDIHDMDRQYGLWVEELQLNDCIRS